MPRFVSLLFFFLLSGWCGAQESALLLVVENRNASKVSRINQELYCLIGQTRVPMAHPLVYDFQAIDHQEYCEQKLGIKRSQLPLIGLVELDQRLGVTRVVKAYPNVDKRPERVQEAVEEWCGEKLQPVYVATSEGSTVTGFEIEQIEAERGGEPFYVLNIRVTLRNGGNESVDHMSMLLYAREASASGWRLLKQWSDLTRLAPGNRQSLDYIGKSAELSSDNFRVKVVVKTPQGTVEKEAPGGGHR